MRTIPAASMHASMSCFGDVHDLIPNQQNPPSMHGQLKVIKAGSFNPTLISSDLLGRFGARTL